MDFTLQVHTSLLPERANQHAAEMTRMTPNRLELARELQQVAFHGRRDYRAFDKDFQPAPLYVSMATALSEDPELAGILIGRIEKAAIYG